MSLTLYIGNKNYSSWSLRAWLALRGSGIEFDEVKLRLGWDPDSEFKRRIAVVSPAGRVPVLVDDGFAVWDTLAIIEYAAERFPERGLWPESPRQRARARSLCAEMHAGFGALRTYCAMNIEADLRELGPKLLRRDPEVRADVDRIEAIWAERLDALGGPLLFGRFSAVDAFFAPVVWRFKSYGLPVRESTAAYIEHVLALPAMREWTADALAEHDFLVEDETYRSLRDGVITNNPLAG